MPGSRICFHRLAAREYRFARDWYRERSEEAAQRFVFAIDCAVERIIADAESLPVLAGVFRYARVTGFPYVVAFRRIEADLVSCQDCCCRPYQSATRILASPTIG
jgi:hypothetical protein